MVGRTSDCEPKKVLITALSDNLPPNRFSSNECISETQIILDARKTYTPVVLGSFCKENRCLTSADVADHVVIILLRNLLP